MQPVSFLRNVRAQAALILTALLALACIAYVFKDQVARPAGQFLQYDELFFSSCAARESVTGWASIAGCHDNKAPLILLTHALIATFFGPYNAGALKISSAVLFSLLTLAGALVAARMTPQRPRTAALATACLLVVALVPRPATLAMKTELMGAFFVLAGLALMLRRPGAPTLLQALLGGIAVGLATMSKQTYALIAPVGLLALLLSSASTQAWHLRLRVAIAFVLGLALPAGGLALLFASHGKLDEFVYSTFVYPGFYGGDAPQDLPHRLIWTGTSFGEFLRFSPTHLIWALLALPVFLTRQRLQARLPEQAEDWALTERRGWLMMMGALFAALLMIAASPLLFESHPIPFWVFSSVLGGAIVGNSLASGQAADRQFANAILLSAALFGVVLTVRSNNGQSRPIGDEALLKAPAGAPVFVLGMAPEFYAYGRFTPASSIQYPWALPGTPRSWAFRAPAENSTAALAAVLHRQQQRNVQTLYEDFARTPPRYIVVFENHAKQPGSPRISDVPGLDAYIQARCHFLTSVRADQPSNGAGRAYLCNPG